MRLSPPKTMLAALLLGYGAVSLALFSTVLLSHWSISELTHHSERLVEEGATVSSLGGRLRDDVTNLERTARQYIVVGDEQLLSLFYQRVSQVNATLTDMANAGFSETDAFSLPEMQNRLAELAKAWNAGVDSEQSFAQALGLIEDLTQNSETVIRAGNKAISEEMDSLRSAAQTSRQRIIIAATTLFPGAVMILWWLLRRTQRALISLRRAINSLGRNPHGQSIVIEGPQELQELGGRLHWLSQRLQELEEDKDRFLRHVSHELKTPLSSLKEAADLIGDSRIGSLNEQQRELREMLLESSQELQAQISHLLAYAAWRREQESLPVEWFSVADFARDLEKTCALQLERKQLRLDTRIACHRWQGNRQKLMEAISNLLSNAIRHAPASSTLELEFTMRGDFALASVRDYGAGVPDEEKTMIFEPFTRGRHAREQGLPGTGVGLSIVSECALAHKGDAYVEDAHPGSRFVLRWPVDMH